MRRKITAAVTAAALALAIGACGQGAENTDTSSASSSSAQTESAASASASSDETAAEETEAADPYADVPVTEEEPPLDECIVLGDYTELGLTREAAEVTDEEIDERIAALVGLEEVTDPDAAVQEGDTVNLAFAGEIDGKPFEGGSSDSYDLEIGSHMFIEGFEEGMVGMKKGESRDLDLAFPENYHNENYAGKPVVFHVTVNTISRPGQLTNAWVSDYSGGVYTTVEEFRESQKESLLKSKQEALDSSLETEIWQVITDRSEFLQFPASYIEEGRQSYDEINESTASSYGLTMDQFKEAYGLDDETYEKQKESYARHAAAGLLVLKAVSEREGVDIESDVYTEKLEEVASEFGMAPEDLIENYGEDTVSEYVLERALADVLMEKYIAG